jgi:hypothetical protein
MRASPGPGQAQGQQAGLRQPKPAPPKRHRPGRTLDLSRLCRPRPRLPHQAWGGKRFGPHRKLRGPGGGQALRSALGHGDPSRGGWAVPSPQQPQVGKQAPSPGVGPRGLCSPGPGAGGKPQGLGALPLLPSGGGRRRFPFPPGRCGFPTSCKGPLAPGPARTARSTETWGRPCATL